MPIDYSQARTLLENEFANVEGGTIAGAEAGSKNPDAQLARDLDTVFRSETLSYREALLGCIVARIQDRSIDLSKPYVNQGVGAFNGRSLDELVVNPFLSKRRIPCTRGPYLSKFRRSIRFDRSLSVGTRDVEACEAFVRCVDRLQQMKLDSEIEEALKGALARFAAARELSVVPINRIQRLNLDQYEDLVKRLLSAKSGGRFPLFIVVASLHGVAVATKAAWRMEWQEINVADSPSGAVGDVTIFDGSAVVLAAEVTEREVDAGRLVSTFNAKIGPASMPDYLFFSTKTVSDETRQQAFRYFAQGHEVNFLNVADWSRNILGTIGQDGRRAFNLKLAEMIDDVRVPQAVKATWNQVVDEIIG
jgi:hypothetical protein